ncbi:LamB/YcsF family protein [Microbacterium sp. 22242]|uniref:LamB/YcsF family protein n=1 Tax=Microbacterium sp. 22242 TaxID=3453896 RepID=UPI003F85B38F
MTLDLNSDLGESFSSWRMGDDAAMLELVSSANVACGFHAGDAPTARRTVRLAARNGVAVGAHVGYRDLAGFGRRFLDVDAETLANETLYQIGALRALAAAEGVRVSYVKPHGALYNRIVHDEAQAAAVVEGVALAGDDLALVGLPGSAVLRIAEERGLRAVREAFADRAYRADGTLVPRSEPGAVIHDPSEVAARVLGLARTGTMTATDGSAVAILADSVCVHGDTPGAVAIAGAVRDALDAAGVTVAPFAPGALPIPRGPGTAGSLA